MRIVLDTNVLLSGMLTRGVCEAVLDACMGSDAHTVVLSEHILREFDRQAKRKFGAPAREVRRAVEFLRIHVEVVKPAHVADDACSDPDDLPVLGTLLAAKADCLVTGDQSLLDLRQFQTVPIVSPRVFYDRWCSEPSG
ncbi:MAG: putative toxin-antitoxin system toxin component, PIN family [Planctomycetota bacterium]